MVSPRLLLFAIFVIVLPLPAVDAHDYKFDGKIHHQPHGKFSDPIAWDDQYSTRMGTPLIIHAPGISANRGRCKRPVSLVDLYPTLIELCGLPDRDDLDGRSLAPLARNPESQWPYPAIITHAPWWLGTISLYSL